MNLYQVFVSNLCRAALEAMICTMESAGYLPETEDPPKAQPRRFSLYRDYKKEAGR